MIYHQRDTSYTMANNKRKRAQTPSNNAATRSKILKAQDSVDATYPVEKAAPLVTFKALNDAINTVNNNVSPDSVINDAMSDTATNNGPKTWDGATDTANHKDVSTSVTDSEPAKTDNSISTGKTASDEAQPSDRIAAGEESKVPNAPSGHGSWSSTPEKIFNEINGYVNVDRQHSNYSNL